MTTTCARVGRRRSVERLPSVERVPSAELVETPGVVSTGSTDEGGCSTDGSGCSADEGGCSTDGDICSVNGGVCSVTGDLREQTGQVGRGEGAGGLVVAVHPPGMEVEIEVARAGLDETPERPAVLAAQRLEPDPREQAWVVAAVVRRRPGARQLGLEPALRRGVAELEARVVVAGVVVVDQPDPLAVVDEVAGQQVVVARDGGTRGRREHTAYVVPGGRVVVVRRGQWEAVLAHHLSVPPLPGEHVEVVDEPRPGMEPAYGV